MDKETLEKGNELKSKIEKTEKDLENLIERINDSKEDDVEVRIATKRCCGEVSFMKGVSIQFSKEEFNIVLETIKTLLEEKIQKYKQEFEEL